MEAVGILILFLILATVGWRLLVGYWEKDQEPEFDARALWLERLQELKRDQ